MRLLCGERRCVLVFLTFALLSSGASFAQAEDESSPVSSSEPSAASGAQEPALAGTSPQLPDEPAMPTPELAGSGPPSEAGEVHERGFGPARLPQSSLPGTALINAGTRSLTAIANQIRVTHKSVSIHVDVSGGLSLPVAVEVTAKFVVYDGEYYASPEQKGIYGAGVFGAGGVHLVHHMPDTPGIPAGSSPGPLAYKVKVYLTLRETDQTARSYSFPVRQLTIIPLYDINLDNLTFQLVKACDSWIRGKSDIHFHWNTPDDKRGVRSFKLNKGETERVPEFHWFKKEAQQVNLFEPKFAFFEYDSTFDLKGPPDFGQAKRLLPVVGRRHRAEMEVRAAEGEGCTAKIAYTIYRKLLTF